MPIPPGLPHPPRRLPLIGDVKIGDLTKPTQRLAHHAKELGSIFEQKVFGYPVVVIAGTDLIEEVNDEEHWEKHIGHTLRKLRAVVDDGLFTASRRNPNWAKAHNILMPAFTKTAMLNYHDSIKSSVRDLTDLWAERSLTQEWVDVSTDANRLTLEIITRAGFSHSFDVIRGQSDTSFVEAALREMTFANRKTDTLPLFEKLFLRKRRRQHEDDVKYAHQVVDQIIAERKGKGAGRKNDILDLMLNTVDPETGEGLDMRTSATRSSLPCRGQ
jgi:cytochrome P450